MQKSENQIIYICGLGASVGYERISEYSTRRDENHRYGYMAIRFSSTLPAANWGVQIAGTIFQTRSRERII